MRLNLHYKFKFTDFNPRFLDSQFSTSFTSAFKRLDTLISGYNSVAFLLLSLNYNTLLMSLPTSQCVVVKFEMLGRTIINEFVLCYFDDY
ncbi:hypothetical protein ACTXT7_009953 [Hymenolepis weldensis]